MADKKITGIDDIRDESSDRAGTRVVIDVKRGAMGQVVLNHIFNSTMFDTTIGCTMLVVDRNRPRTMNLVQVLQAYIDHRLEVILRRSIFRLKEAEARMHIVSGLIKAVENIDEVVEIIKGSSDRDNARKRLMERFDFSEIQATAIVDMRLHQLTGLAIAKLQDEFAELTARIEYLKSLIESRDLRIGVVKDELLEVKEKYADERRTEITMDDSDLNIADLIPRHSCVITVSNTGYIKRVPVDTYRTYHRGGKGIIGMETKEEDHVEHLFSAHSHDIIFFFTDRGFMYWLNVYEIPEGLRTGKGKAIINLIKVQPGEKICAMLTVTREELERSDRYIVMATKNGIIKKTELALFKNLRRTGLRALVIEDDDDLIGAGISGNGDEILLSSRLGMACRFDQTDDQIRPMGRTARGVTGMRFKLEGDEVVSMEIVSEPTYDEAEIEVENENEEANTTETEVEVALEEDASGVDAFGAGPEVLVVTDGGMGKRSYVSAYRKTNRGARGVVNIKLREGEHVLSVIQISGDDEILLTSERGQLTRIPAHEIRRVGRASLGVRIMNLNAGDRLTGVARIIKIEGENDSDNAENAVDITPADENAPAEIPVAENSGNETPEE